MQPLSDDDMKFYYRIRHLRMPELELLYMLTQNKDQLINIRNVQVVGIELSGTLQVYIHRLRKKFPMLDIENVWGQGYIYHGLKE